LIGSKIFLLLLHYNDVFFKKNIYKNKKKNKAKRNKMKLIKMEQKINGSLNKTKKINEKQKSG